MYGDKTKNLVCTPFYFHESSPFYDNPTFTMSDLEQLFLFCYKFIRNNNVLDSKQLTLEDFYKFASNFKIITLKFVCGR